MSLNTMLTQVCSRIGITAPTSFTSSSDAQILQLIALANEEGQELAARYPWQAITIERTFASVAAEIQGAITTLAGPDFKYILNNIMWDRSLLRPVLGPLLPAQWQELKARNITGPWSQYRIRGGNVLFIPIPAVGDTIAFEYISTNWVTLNAGGTGLAWANDADIGLLDEQVMAQGCIWRWQAAKGVAYSENFDKYERLANDAMGRDGGKPILNLEGLGGSFPYGVTIALGSWDV